MEDNNQTYEEMLPLLKWKEITPRKIKTFQLDEEPELIHIIETSFEDTYIVVYEDGFEQLLGKSLTMNKEQIKKVYNIEL
jgi:hypothetical protein